MSELGDDHASPNINSRPRSGAIQEKPLRCLRFLAALPTCMAVLVILASTLTACGGGDMVSSSEAAPTITAARSPSAPSTPAVKPKSSPVPTRPPTSTVEAGSVLASQKPSQTLAPTPGNCGSGFLVFLLSNQFKNGQMALYPYRSRNEVAKVLVRRWFSNRSANSGSLGSRWL
jgi:hypothetical protein